MMDLTENMYQLRCSGGMRYQHCLPYGDVTMDLGKPFERMTMIDAVKKYAGVDFNAGCHIQKRQRQLQMSIILNMRQRHKKGDILNLFFEEYVEEHLDSAYLHYGSSY